MCDAGRPTHLALVEEKEEWHSFFQSRSQTGWEHCTIRWLKFIKMIRGCLPRRRFQFLFAATGNDLPRKVPRRVSVCFSLCLLFLLLFQCG